MRVIGGKLKGRRLKSVPKAYVGVKPISGRIKQSLFDIISGIVPGCRFLDVFAGTGAVGMEALSRGADFVFFIDMDRRCLSVIEENIALGGFQGRAKACFGNALNELSWVGYRSGCGQYDIVFLGPPYKDEDKKPLALSTRALERVAQAGLLAPQGWLICQHHAKEEVHAPGGLVLARRQKYGDTFLDFYQPQAA